MSIDKKKMAAGLLGLVALACTGATAQAQMMRGGRMGGMMMGGMIGGMRGPFMVQPSPMVSPTMSAVTPMGGFNPGMGLFQPRMVRSTLNLGTGLTNFSVSGLNTFGNGLAMPFRAGYGMGGYGMGGYGMDGYGMGGYGTSGYGMGGMGAYGMGGYGAAGGGYGMSNNYGAGSVNYGSSSQGELPHPAGDVKVAPADAAVIRLRVPHQFATVSFNGQSVSGIGTTRTYVTPNLESGKSWSYVIKAVWSTANGQRSAEKVIEARPGQISNADFTRE
jgi:uncharacterized protein (TIGR03000 family)